MPTPDSFDETFYLHAYPDVADAVARGVFLSGYDHYMRFGETEGRRAAPSIDDLLRCATTDTVFLELTSRCNLRCVYCAVSQPAYHGIDLPLKGFDVFLEQMRARGVRTVVMNGHGESTIIKGWDVYADRLADAGFRLQMTTNLAKRLTPHEIAVLSRFERILVSIDTIDPELFAALRRGGNLETTLGNIEAVQGFAAARRRNPEIYISCTVGDLSAPGILDLVNDCLGRGIRRFRFGDLIEYRPVDAECWMQHASKLPAETLEIVRVRFREALARIEAAGGSFEIDSTLRSLLDRSAVEMANRETRISDKTVPYVEAGGDQTRDCLDPWQIAFVQADASVRPCCFFEEKLGTLMSDSLEGIVEGDGFRALRREIVTGQLRLNCRSCAARPLIDRAAFERKLAASLSAQSR